VIAPLVLLGLLAATYALRGPLPLEPEPPEGPRVRLAFAGDLSMALAIGHNLEALAAGSAGVEPGYPFAGVTDRIASADLAIGNLECVVSPLGTPKPTAPVPFRAPELAFGSIQRAGFDIVSVANNHVLDYGPVALDDMVARLDRTGLPHIGVGRRSLAPEAPLIREIHGIRLGFFAFYDVNIEKACRDVARARGTVDLLVVFNHWGIEAQTSPDGHQRSFGHALIDAGADLVVGAHAHVLQPEEWYRGKLLFYGLGNFVFAGMGFDEPHRIGGLLEVDLSRHGVVARRLYRTRLDDTGAPRWLDPEPFEPERLPR
jgi:poly-gamma-glutamate capsule biosynthesis protein CapA/YwtB (metallophosphatase superfamily)